MTEQELTDPEHASEDQSTILVVDDVEPIRQFVELALSSDKWKVISAATGKEALDILDYTRCDLVMLDLGLPDMDGLEVCRRLKENPRTDHIPVLGFTGEFPDSEDKVKGFQAGLADYLIKPLDVHELRARVAMHVKQKLHHDAMTRAFETESERAQNMLRETQERFTALAENSFDLISELDEEGHCIYASANHEQILGYKPIDIIGNPMSETLHPEDIDHVESKIHQLFSRNSSMRFFLRQRHEKGHYLWFEATGKVYRTANGERRLVLTCRDTTEQKQREDRLDFLANHDLLTGLHNRNALYDILSRFVEQARNGQPGTLLFMDLDHLKIINDTVGHTAGDYLIEAIANMLRESITDQDALVRFAGDEFIVMFSNTRAERGFERADKICRLINSYRFTRGGQSFQPRVSIGLVEIDGQMSGEELIAKADAACYTAKRAGGDRVAIFKESDSQIAKLKSDSDMLGNLKEAMQENRLKTWYMPIMELQGDQVAYYEALLRMKGKDGTFHVPGDFLSAAERFKIIDKIDFHVIKQTLTDLSTYPDLKVSINLSGHTIGNDFLRDYILSQIDDLKIDPTRISFEITETAFISNLGQAADFVRDLQEIGIRFALDDFGCGFSSLSYLRDIPVDYIKIDGSFIRTIVDEKLNQALVRSITDIAHLLNKKTVAEYVSDQPSFDLIKQLGVDFAQGYFVGTPEPIEKLPVYASSSSDLSFEPSESNLAS